MLNESTRVIGRPRQAGQPSARTTAAIIATAVLVLLASACSGGGSSTDSGGSPQAEGSSSSPSALAYSACMRSHGVPNFPDPNANGRPLEVDAQQLGVSDSLYQAAEQACQRLLPTGGSLQELTHQCLLYGDCPQSLVQQLMTLERTYAQCMRSHGVPNWPDPSISAKGGSSGLRSQWGRHRPAVHGFAAVQVQGSRMPAPDRRRGAEPPLHVRNAS